MKRVFLLRHGLAGDRSAWSGPDEARPLDEAGRRQAEALADLLAGEPIDRIVSSPSLRCVQTVEPLAAATGLPIETDGALEEGAGATPAARLILEAAGRSVVCTHGDVVEDLLGHLVPGGAVACDKGAAWILDVERGRITGRRYLPPPRIAGR